MMTAARAGSPLLCSPQCVKSAGFTDPGHLSCAEFESVDCLATVAASALRLELQSEVKRMRAGEWGKAGRFGWDSCLHAL